jgi:hypothetical protein
VFLDGFMDDDPAIGTDATATSMFQQEVKSEDNGCHKNQTWNEPNV